MQLTPWNAEKIAQYNDENGQALLIDEHTLASFSHDFGKLKQIKPQAVCIPKNTASIQKLLQFASQYALPVVVRGNGLSQNGQSLPAAGGITLSMERFNHVLSMTDDRVWVEANTSWSALLESTLPRNKIPFALPYNCNLSVGGVLSAGGVGASSFKYGAIAANAMALEVIDGNGELHKVESDSSLFQACLGGQGRFGVITKAAIALRKVSKHVKTFSMVYDNTEDWFDDFNKVQSQADFVELFCSPSIQGMKLTNHGRKPLVQWLYGMQISMEYNEQTPQLPDLTPWKLLHEQEENIASYLLRHDARFEVMKRTGSWDLIHPWYECFIPTAVLRANLTAILDELPPHYANFVHIVPIAKRPAGWFELPQAPDLENDSVCALMILNPGVNESLKPSCLQAIQTLDAFLLPRGGKRYLSGYLGEKVDDDYWKFHFGKNYGAWLGLKREFDPVGVLCSSVF